MKYLVDFDGNVRSIPPITAVDVGAIAASEKGATVATLVNGIIPDSQLPPIAITETFVVNTQAAMLALTAQSGDVAVRTDALKTFILKSAPPSILANWQELPTPLDTILSINGKTGVVVLNPADVGAIALSEKGANNGVATLVNGTVPYNQLPAVAPLTSVMIERVPQGSLANIGQWVNQPAALTELYGNANNRALVDLQGFSFARLIVNVLAAGAGSSFLKAEVSTTGGLTWTSFIPNTGGLSVNISVVGIRQSGWFAITESNKVINAQLRIIGEGGNAIADPQFNRIEIQLK